MPSAARATTSSAPPPCRTSRRGQSGSCGDRPRAATPPLPRRRGAGPRPCTRSPDRAPAPARHCARLRLATVRSSRISYDLLKAQKDEPRRAIDALVEEGEPGERRPFLTRADLDDG